MEGDWVHLCVTPPSSSPVWLHHEGLLCSISSSTTHTHSLQGAKVLDLLGDSRYQTIATFTDTASGREALSVQLSLFSGSTDEEKQQDMSKCDVAISGHMSGIKLVFVSLFIKRLQVSR